MRYDYDWLNWGVRFRRAMRLKGSSLRKLSTLPDAVAKEAGLRHYTNNTRSPTLADFFKLCEQIESDPREILFGPLAMTNQQRKAATEAVMQVMSGTAPETPKQPRKRTHA